MFSGEKFLRKIAKTEKAGILARCIVNASLEISRIGGFFRLAISKRIKIIKTESRVLKVDSQPHSNFVLYRQKNSWNEQAILMTELNALN